MKFVVGLGNPGKRYDGTPHNVGFEVIDRLAVSRSLDEPGDRPRRRFKVEYFERRFAEERVLLVKPLTYMNLSGPAVQSILGYFKGVTEDLLVLHDDLDLPVGRLRFRARGSSGGHRGVASLIESLGTRDFARLKIGVCVEPGTGSSDAENAARTRDAADYVLARLSASRREELGGTLDRATEAVDVWLRDGVERGAQLFNGVDPTASKTGSETESDSDAAMDEDGGQKN